MCMMKSYRWIYFRILLVLVSAPTIKCEWLSSMGQLEDLLYAEEDLITSLRQYIQAEEDKLERVKRVADEFQKDLDNAKSDIDGYLGHPVNQYRLMHRFMSEWSDVENLLKEDVSDVFRNYLSIKREHLPNGDDVMGVAQVIMRLQDTYTLDTHDIAQGIMKGARANKTLSAEECFYIGMTAYHQNDYYHCTLWMNEALQHNDLGSLSKFDVLDYLAYCVAEQGNIHKAYELTSEMLKINSKHKRINKNYRLYRKQLKAHKENHQDDADKVPFADKLKRSIDPVSFPYLEDYERLCQQENNTIPRKIEKRLRCRYWTNGNHPRLILQPAKVEELWHSPHVVRFHDIISDKEISEIKLAAKPELDQTGALNSITGNKEYASYLISKTAWIDDGESLVVENFSTKISDLTGLSVDTAEALQISNYGVGGQYEPHYDYDQGDKVKEFSDSIGDRIATFMVYLSDVEPGGNTVFPKAGVAVQPVKGSAIFWYNLLASGEGDARTLYAACPVLTGVKWVANKWIHARDQEFRRPCGLKKNSDNRLF